MPARHHAIGEPAHPSEAQAIDLLVRGLPDDAVVYSNGWAVERDGRWNEVDAVVMVPAVGVWVVEIKGYHGRVTGNEHDWYVGGGPIRSPLRLNDKTAKVLASGLGRELRGGRRPRVEGLVFLSEASEVDLSSLAARQRTRTRETILDALIGADGWMATLCGGRPWAVDDEAQRALHRLMTGIDRDRAPPRTIRDWQLQTTLESTDRYTEVLASHRITPNTRRVLRIWPLPQLADATRRDLVYGQLRWEADVLQRVGRHPGVLQADPFFEDERGLVLPLELFDGVSLHTWLEHHKGQRLEARVQLWRKIAETVAHCHSQGVVHRQLRPEVVRVSDRAENPDIRIVGFDLAKLEGVSATVTTGRLKDADLQFAAPEVVQQFGKAEPRSDIFGLGVLLATLAVGRPPFESTVELLRRNGVVTPLREVAPGISQRLDDAVRHMLASRAAAALAVIAAARRQRQRQQAGEQSRRCCLGSELPHRSTSAFAARSVESRWLMVNGKCASSRSDLRRAGREAEDRVERAGPHRGGGERDEAEEAPVGLRSDEGEADGTDADHDAGGAVDGADVLGEEAGHGATP